MKTLLLTSLLFLALFISCKKTNTSNGGTSAPVITGVVPTAGAPGTVINILGQNFGSTPAANTVYVNNSQATVSAANSTSISVTVPSGATSGPVRVIVNGATAVSPSNFSVITVLP